MMSPQEKQKIAERIHQEITKTELDIARLEAANSPVSPDNAIGRISRMEAINARAVNNSALLLAQQRLRGLKSAMSNLNEPEFGSCVECGDLISLERILLMPHVKMCVGCAEQYES
ncbi:MAG: TraR/DksA family transcriptional regulator [Desulfobulbaceae bacterium]|nr:MAG: TraR/DksA family transcriptional regulator [Desulfobulbaceae bacterium]